MKVYDLFPSRIHKSKIDPSSYDKDTIIRNVMTNYELDKTRNVWDKHSKLHHYLNDWGNEDFKLDLSPILGVYKIHVDNFMRSINFSANHSYRWHVANMAVDTEYMVAHDHFNRNGDYQTLYSCTHYIKFNPEKHAKTTFINPLPVTYFPSLSEPIRTAVDPVIGNSAYFSTWELPTEEDDFIIFPSYLKHTVFPKEKCDDIRIIGVINIDVNISNFLTKTYF